LPPADPDGKGDRDDQERQGYLDDRTRGAAVGYHS